MTPNTVLPAIIFNEEVFFNAYTSIRHRKRGSDMNFIKAINAFYDQQEYNPLSSGAISLWFGLMHVNNKARWREEFSAPMTVLCMKTSMSESSIRKARQELVEKGYLTFVSRGGNQAPVYQLAVLYEEETGSVSDSDGGSANGKESGSRNALVKQNETKENEDEVVRNPHRFYESNVGTLSPFIAEQMTQWADELSDELVIESLKLAIRNNKPFFSYAEAILKQWKATGVRSLNEARLAREKPKSKGKPNEQKALFDKLRKEVEV
ncbi:DnaD domain protein [Halobacillus fulvus]|nr:DnaD domain protein [Halobacillus fulvus]